MNQLKFPKNFKWGTATAAYQIEGAYNIDGKGPSIWDEFVTRKNKIKNKDTGNIACDHYNQFNTDIQLMKKLHYSNYRFSISWPRILPEGRGKINSVGLDFYDRLVDTLLKNKINPFVTLYHWDLPLSLQNTGGWLNRNTAQYFADFSEIVAKKLGDRVKDWITINEPWIIYVTGYMLGVHPPGKIQPYSSLPVVHNLLLGHGLALQRLRKFSKKSRIGITNALSPVQYFKWQGGEKTVARANAFQNSMWMDPIFYGRYPIEIEDEIYSQNKNNIKPEDFKIISQPTDFLGVNHYTRTIVRWAPTPLFRYLPVKPKYKDVKFTSMGWEVYPKGIKDLLDWIRIKYNNPPVYITENGAAFFEKADSSGFIKDNNRVQFLQNYLTEVHHSIQEGSNVQGYFVWSFLDNFEWQEGYEKSFGLIYVDRKSAKLTRTPKSSAYWYSDVCKKNGFAIQDF